MTVAFVSDIHLTPDTPEILDRFREFADRIPSRARQLYILGDLFEFWIGDDGTELLGHSEAEALLKRISDSGVDLYFIHGNRDFLVGGEFARRTGCKILPDPTVIELGGSRILMSHGDSLCIQDTEHQARRRQMTSSKWKVAFLDQPLDRRLATAREMRGKSEAAKQQKDMHIMDVDQEHLEQVMRQHRTPVLIHGHTHRPAVHRFRLDGVQATRIVLGDWYTQQSMLVCEDGHYSLYEGERLVGQSVSPVFPARL